MTYLKTHPQLLQILQTKRKHNSVGDYLFRAWLLDHLATYKPWIAGDGNIVVKLGESRVAFSCHVDTCHSLKESDGTLQVVSEDMGVLFLGSDSRCLGADDGIGIFFMLQLIDAKIPGTYIFHTGEECGAEGSQSINRDCLHLTDTFDLIVAFDRAVLPGQQPEIIITQSGTPCASEECGQALADALNAVEPDLGFVISHRGVFTDTLNYVDNVAQCLNVGCFYADQHTPGEFVDIEKVNMLLKAVLSISWDSLPTQRRAELEFDKPWDFSTSAEEEDLYCALTRAVDGCYGDLKEMTARVGAEVYGLDADEAECYIKNRLLTKKLLKSSLENFDGGAAAQDVLLYIFDEATK